MKIGQLARDVKIASTGFNRAAGGTIAENEVPPVVWRQWVDEGIVILPPSPAPARVVARARRRKRAIP